MTFPHALKSRFFFLLGGMAALAALVLVGLVVLMLAEMSMPADIFTKLCLILWVALLATLATKKGNGWLTPKGKYIAFGFAGLAVAAKWLDLTLAHHALKYSSTKALEKWLANPNDAEKQMMINWLTREANSGFFESFDAHFVVKSLLIGLLIGVGCIAMLLSRKQGKNNLSPWWRGLVWTTGMVVVVAQTVEIMQDMLFGACATQHIVFQGPLNCWWDIEHWNILAFGTMLLLFAWMLLKRDTPYTSQPQADS